MQFLGFPDIKQFPRPPSWVLQLPLIAPTAHTCPVLCHQGGSDGNDDDCDGDHGPNVMMVNDNDDYFDASMMTRKNK